MRLRHEAQLTCLLVIGTSFLPWDGIRAEEEMKVVVQRESTTDGLITGRLIVDGKDVGPCFENEAKKIPAREYRGILRYTSGKNFVQGPGGVLGTSGDFLLEVANVDDRTDILFHAGNKKEHSEGCILCGPAITKSGKKFAPDALQKLRLAFYDGVDDPVASPNKRIAIVVKDPAG